MFDGDTPTLSEVIEAGVSARLETLWTAIPGTVKSYDPAQGCADVTPAVRQIDGAGEVVDLPVIVCMPVLFPSGGGYSLTWPLNPGDPCLVVFSSLALAQWLQGGNTTADPEAPRRNALSDGIVIPGMRPFSDPLNAPAAVAFNAGKDDQSQGLSIDAAGVVTIEAPARINLGAGAVDLVALAPLVDAIVSAVQIAHDTHTHPVTAIAAPTGPPSALINPQASVAAVKTFAE